MIKEIIPDIAYTLPTGSDLFIVTITLSGSTHYYNEIYTATADKTVAQITAAYEAGKDVYAAILDSYIPFSYGNSGYAEFEHNRIEANRLIKFALNGFTDVDSNNEEWRFRATRGTCDSDDIVDIIYPVGSIYMAVNNTNPATLFGGTWTQIKDTFLLSAGDTYNGGETGGEAAHVLTINEMPQHGHGTRAHFSSGNDQAFGFNYTSGGKITDATKPNASLLEFSGNSESHNNMPPYLVVYMWKRTA